MTIRLSNPAPAGAASPVGAGDTTYDFMADGVGLSKIYGVSGSGAANSFEWPSSAVATKPTRDAEGLIAVAGINPHTFYRIGNPKNRVGYQELGFKVGAKGTFGSFGLVFRARTGALGFLRYETEANAAVFFSHVGDNTYTFLTSSGNLGAVPAVGALGVLKAALNGNIVHWSLWINGLRTGTGTFNFNTDGITADYADTEFGLRWEPTANARLRYWRVAP